MVELKLQVDNQPAMWQLRSDCGDGSRHEGKMRAVMAIAMTMYGEGGPTMRLRWQSPGGDGDGDDHDQRQAIAGDATGMAMAVQRWQAIAGDAMVMAMAGRRDGNGNVETAMGHGDDRRWRWWWRWRPDGAKAIVVV